MREKIFNLIMGKKIMEQKEIEDDLMRYDGMNREVLMEILTTQ